jgi:hypothetical protein
MLCFVGLRSVPESNGSPAQRIAYLPRSRFRSVSWLGGFSNIIEFSLMTSKDQRGLPIASLKLRSLAIQNQRQWHAPRISALQSRGGDGFSPSSRARSLW